MYAAAKGNTNILNQLFRQKDIRISQTDALGRTPLFYSIYAPSTEAARLLLQKGENLNQVEKYGNTPLMYAIKAQKDPIALFFIQQGASLAQADNQGATAFTLAPVYLPGSATEKVLGVKQQTLQANALQEQAARLANVRELEQQLREDEAKVQQLKQQQVANLQNQSLQEQARLQNIAHAQQVKAQLQQQSKNSAIQEQARLQNIAHAQQVKAQLQQTKALQPTVTQTIDNDPEIIALQRQLEALKAQKAAALQKANNVVNQTRTNAVYYDALGRPIATSYTTTTHQVTRR